jgi:hypothetical protein
LLSDGNFHAHNQKLDVFKRKQNSRSSNSQRFRSSVNIVNIISSQKEFDISDSISENSANNK